MGGKGSGGARVGAGRKPKDAHLHWLGGDAGKRGRTPKPAVTAPPVVLIPAPRCLTDAQRAVWHELAPHACAARTLVPATAAAFAALCERLVLLRVMADQIERDGLMNDVVSLQMDESGGGLQSVTKKAHDLLSRYLALMQRVDAGMQRFCLAPMGKPVASLGAEAPTDEWAEFDAQVN